LSSPLAEVREIGETVKAVAQGELPTLVKYAEAVEYLVETTRELEIVNRKLGIGNREIGANL
jgi:hypothetical protein